VTGAGQIRQIGLGIAAGVLMDTFLIRTLLIPSVAPGAHAGSDDGE